MTILSTMRQHQRRRARSVLALVAMVWVSVALQACATSPQASELVVDRPAHVEVPHISSDQSGRDSQHDCAQSLDCGHDGCAEPSSCEGPVVVSTKVETRLPDITEIESAATVAIDDLDLGGNSPNTSLMRPRHRVSAAAVPFTVQYCVYLI